MLKRLYCALLLVCASSGAFGYNIGLLVVATGKYTQFVMPLIESGRRYFCPNHNVTYFIFTDGQLPEADDIVVLPHERLGWPKDTLMRCAVYNKYRDAYKDMDYLFATDADMLFVDTVGDEILSELVATQHPGYVGKRGTYETNPISAAYVAPGRTKQYFCGGFNGGTREAYLAMLATLEEQINRDLEKGYIAVWHDESHVNRYFADHAPTLILSPSYCFPGADHLARAWGIAHYHPRLVAIVKNHSEFQT